MPKRNEITKVQVEEIEEYRRKNRDKNKERRLKALVLHAQGMKHEEIAEKTDFASSYVGDLVSKYCNYGLFAIVGNHYRGNRRKLSVAEEKALLEPFVETAAAGQIVEIGDIKRAYEEKTGCSLENNHGQIYRVLKRHGWRKVMPRSEHPDKASDEESRPQKN